MIPRTAHFIWYGEDLPWVHALAIRSAHDRGGFERVVLHHADDLSRTRAWPELTALPHFEPRRIDVPAILRASGGDVRVLDALHASLRAPNARANVLRAAILAGEGGLYLDLDTVTVADLGPLLGAGAVCGLEHVIYPRWVMRSRNPVVRLRSLALGAAREALRRLPDGWRTFRRIQGIYPLAVNNAVLGAAKGHPFVHRLLDAMARVPAERRTVRFALGTHLLQEQVALDRGGDLVVHPPEVFYPLAPEISEHWFRPTRRVALDEILGSETRVVHWYASVRTAGIVPRIDPAWVDAHAGDVPFAALARRVSG
jgi:hypothetical protein